MKDILNMKTKTTERKAFIIIDEECGDLLIVATTMGEAIKAWRRWLVDNSDGAVTSSEVIGWYPPNIAEFGGCVIEARNGDVD